MRFVEERVDPGEDNREEDDGDQQTPSCSETIFSNKDVLDSRGLGRLRLVGTRVCELGQGKGSRVRDDDMMRYVNEASTVQKIDLV
jgi:hypothetical protein